MRAGSLAMRVGDGTQTEGLYWLLTDHLGSTAITTDNAGNKSGEVRYKAWGETRFTSGSTPTTFRFTGQRQEEQLGLYFYNARWYDPALGRFIQADTVVPGMGEDKNNITVGYLSEAYYSPLTVSFGEIQLLDQLNIENKNRIHFPKFQFPPTPINSKAFDRYAYSLNNPVRYTDPSGHLPILPPLVIALTAISPLGWVAIGLTAAAVAVYFTVPGVREAVTDGLYQIVEEVEDAAEEVLSNQRNDENQEALVDLAQEAKQKDGVSVEDAQTLMDWADEYNVIPHSNQIEKHPYRNFKEPHIRIGPINHIPIHGR